MHPVMRWIVASLAVTFLLASGDTAAFATTFLFDDFSGGTVSGVISGTNGVTFTPSTAVFGSPHDGIEYANTFFPASAVMEARIRVDDIDPIGPPYDFGTIFDSGGADARYLGDIFLAVTSSGHVQFTISSASGVNPYYVPQVVSQTSILDGSYHVVGVRYGTAGIELRIDGLVEDSDSFAGTRRTSRPVSVGDFTDRMFPDAQHAFAFIGEVDWIRSGDDFSVVPEPNTALLVVCGLAGLALRRRLSA